MKIGIIGAGITGLSAAYDLLPAGHNVTLYEASDSTGGLARGFRDGVWEWPLEHFYHHIFESDKAIIGLSHELGMGDSLFFPAPRTSMWYDGKVYPFSNPADWWRFPAMSATNYVRFGVIGAFLRFSKAWRWLEKYSADSWTRQWYGESLHKLIWKPLLIGKFGPHYQEANMAWLWARLHVRSFKLGYFRGGFQAFINRLTDAVQDRGGIIHLNAPVQKIVRLQNSWQVTTQSGSAEFDAVIHTSNPALLTKLVELPPAYAQKLTALKSMGAAVVTFALKRQLLTDGTYWLNLPTETFDKSGSDVPFLALVEHTNYIGREHYGGDHIVYCGDYVTSDHPYLSMSKEALVARFASALVKFNPEFDPSWIRDSWLFRTTYAQPVPQLNHGSNVPDLATPLPHLYMASMSQVYPWDRGTNFAVEIGRKVAKEIR